MKKLNTEGKERIFGIVLIIIGLVLLVFFMRDRFPKKEVEKTEAQVTFKLDDLKEENEEEQQQAETDPFFPTDADLPEEIYGLLDLTKEELETKIRDWGKDNGYPELKGAAFYPEMTADFAENRYSFTLQLLPENNDEALLYFVYDKEKEICEFHIW